MYKKEQIKQHLDFYQKNENDNFYEVIISSKPGHDSIVINFYTDKKLDLFKKQLTMMGYNCTEPKIGDAVMIAIKHIDGPEQMDKKKEINSVKDLLQSYGIKINVFSGANM